MFGKEKIPAIQAEIEQTKERLKQARAFAAGLLQYGQAQAVQLRNYYTPRMSSRYETVRDLVAEQPTAWVAGWGENERWKNWEPEEACEAQEIRVGDLVERHGKKLTLLPGFVPFIGQNRTIILRGGGTASDIALELLQSLVIRTALMLPHQTRYTLIDPSGAGRAFPMRKYLPQVRENTGDVRRDLDGVIVDIQRVIETYLDPVVTSFEQVPQAMRVNEAYQFVFAANFPKNYDRRAIEALRQIGNTGGIAGVYLFMHYNTDYELPRDESIEGIENAYFLDVTGSNMKAVNQLTLHLDSVPQPKEQTRLFEILQSSKPPERAMKWEELEDITADSDNWWGASATEYINSQIGVQGSHNALNIWFGAQDGRPCAHGLLGAMTGAGKSNLYHVMIASLATQYSPDELRLYLIDGKDGVELQPYRQLPHVEVVSLRSSPELSRSVLSDLISEKERRNSLFTSVGARDFVEYRTKGQPHGPLPRILLLVDEYQQLFEGDRDGHASTVLLQLAAQGRSVGIHMFLGSQHFGAAGMLYRQEIFGNFHLRAAMQMANDDIQALTEFGRKGKAIITATCDLPGKIVINDRSGDDSANKPGKVAWLNSEMRTKLLQELAQKAKQFDGNLPKPIIFDGKKQPSILDNPQFSRLLVMEQWPTSSEIEKMARKPLWENGFNIPGWFAGEYPHVAWLGQDFSVRGQATVVLRRRVTENIMMVGNANSERYGMLAGFIASLALNAPPPNTRFVLIDCGIPGTPWSEALSEVHNLVLSAAGFDSTLVKQPHQVESVVQELVAEVEHRQSISSGKREDQPEVFVIASELDRVDALRQQVGSYGMVATPANERFARIYSEGPPLGIHLLLSFSGIRPMASIVDEREGIIHFRHRIATQMSDDASHTLFRDREAARLQEEGPVPVSALYFDVEGDRKTRFKPYTIKQQIDEDDMFEQLRKIGEQLASRSRTT